MSSHTPNPLSRRAVLSAAGAFTIVSPQAVRGTQANSKVSIGLIGSGGRGTYDARIAHNDPRGQVTALCDLFDDRIEQAKAALKLEKADEYKDYQKLLANPSIDAVIIATPPYMHPEQFEAAVQAKKHIFCEKPAGVDIAGCQRVIRAGRKADPKKVISFGFQQRYGPVYLEAWKRVKEDMIGPLAAARAYWIGGDPFVRRDYPGLDPKMAEVRNWFCYAKYSGDIIVEQDCHNFDVLHWFLEGLPVRAVGYSTRKVRLTMDIVDNLTVSFEWPNNMLVNYEANQLTPRGFSKVGEEFTGTKGTITVSRGAMTHFKGQNDSERIDAKRDITFDALEQFLNRILTGDVENVAERSALSTMIALLGREAIYTRKEQTWKGLFGNIA